MSSTSTSVSDRQRQRTERGLRSTKSAAARDRVPSAPRRRRPTLAVVAVLLIVGGALIAGLLALRMDDRVMVLVANKDIPAGQQITAADLSTTKVSYDQVSLVPEDQADVVIGTYTEVNIEQGQLIDAAMLTRSTPLSADRAIVGVTLASGRVPLSKINPGDKVLVVRLGDGQRPAVEITEALVLSTRAPTQGSLGSGGSAGSGSLLVPEEAARAVVDASGNDLLGLALLEQGQSPEDVQLAVRGEETD